MTRRINLTVVVKVIDLDIHLIYSHNHMVGMNKIYSSVLGGGYKCVEKMGVGWGVWSKATIKVDKMKRKKRSYLYSIKGV